MENCLQYLAERGFSVQAPAAHNVMQLDASEEKGNTLCDGLSGCYSNGIHIGSIFLILGVSFLGTAIPIASKLNPVLGR